MYTCNCTINNFLISFFPLINMALKSKGDMYHIPGTCIHIPVCSTSNCDGTLKHNGHTKVWWFVLNPDGLTHFSPMVHMQSTYFRGVTLICLMGPHMHQSSIVFPAKAQWF